MREQEPRENCAAQSGASSSTGDRTGRRRRKAQHAIPSQVDGSESRSSEDARPRKVSIGVGWSSHFERPGWQSLYYRKLRYAYRAPSFFLRVMLAHQADVKFLRFDEDLRLADLEGDASQLAESADLIYLASHGEYKAHDYSLALHDSNWRPCTRGLGTGSLSVAVFDTCNLVDLNDPAWQEAWISSAGAHLRLLLGFASPATVATDSTDRGRQFAEDITAGNPLGPAWLCAVYEHAYPGADVGVAIGFGDDEAGADWALHEMTLNDLPCPRKAASPPFIRVEVDH